ncbi:MAG: hypothetical protein IKK93_10405 [Campylobacter sp.]|nr:hypothetical protein [Campylobacter sp.]
MVIKSNYLDGVLIIIDSIRNFINVDFAKDDKITSFLDNKEWKIKAFKRFLNYFKIEYGI